jgi:sensor histidine kinase YesM
VNSRKKFRWLLDHTFLMGWRFRALGLGELLVCLLATVALGAFIGAGIGLAALLVSGHWRHFGSVELRAIALTVVFSVLFFATGGLTGVYLVPMTMRLAGSFGNFVRGVLFFLAGVITMAIGLRLYTPITGLKVAHGLAPVMAIADGVIVCVLGIVIVRFHQLENEMRQAYDRLREQEQRAAELRELAAKAEVTALQAQINPHFFFNTLNSISALVEMDPSRANDAIQKLADLFRYTLGASRRATVPLEDEWNFLLYYLSKEQIRLGSRLEADISLDPAVTRFEIPGLLLQPLVENAVLHGITPYPSGGTVRLSAHSEPDGLVIEIENVPRNSSESAAKRPVFTRSAQDVHGHALENIRRRLAALYPGRHELRLENLHGAGTRVTLVIYNAVASAGHT